MFSLLLAIAMSCSASTSARVPMLTVSTELTLFQPGDSIEVRLGNLADEPLEYPYCGWRLLRFDGRAWKTVPADSSLPPCVDRLDLLPPRTTALVWAHLGAAGTSAIHRLVFTAYDASDQLLPEEERTSNPFRIQ